MISLEAVFAVSVNEKILHLLKLFANVISLNPALNISNSTPLRRKCNVMIAWNDNQGDKVIQLRSKNTQKSTKHSSCRSVFIGVSVICQISGAKENRVVERI